MEQASQPVEAVVFDVGRVIIQWQLRRLFEKLIEDEAELDWFLANVVTEEWHGQVDAGVPLDHMIALHQQKYPDHAELIAAYGERFLESIPGPVPGTVELIERLDDAGRPLFAITNFGSEFWGRFRPTMPVFDRFRDIVVSGDEKLAKPDPAIFDLAAARFARRPETMLFIDDNADNIAAARALGWQTHHFADADALERDLLDRRLI
ncbi:HAD-IA family hydrolase [Altererythrobacter aurantiacus]|uniref:HAD-IA family hydrolase n=1 Tax=Parapontixanthobacter aurantiacus TaxID=1463599 RepID=A0A844ZL08_9SPHN|nr:HAD family phosphatase [Parapontixanthobacter aurantiacus]MXO86369.1 HAD-IA family hydrolase [Parapontixanthobacter aurantiacus]